MLIFFKSCDHKVGHKIQAVCPCLGQEEEGKVAAPSSFFPFIGEQKTLLGLLIDVHLRPFARHCLALNDHIYLWFWEVSIENDIKEGIRSMQQKQKE